jgi:hypothetical protein
MAWVVEFESEMGRFHPYGDFPEFEERLRTYFAEEMSAAEKAVFGHESNYLYTVSCKFTKEIGVPQGGGGAAGLVARTLPRDHEWPTTFRATRKIRSLGSIIKVTNSVLIIEEAMKNMIAGLEPGIHQFRPLTLLQPNSEIFPGTYFTMIVGQFRDSFFPDPETEGELWKRSSYLDSDKVRKFTGAYTCFAAGEKSYARLSFSSSAIGDAHLWRERKFLGGDFFISDALQQAAKTAKLKVPQHFKVREA